MDRELSQDYVKRSRNKKILIISGSIIGFIAIVILFRSLITPSLDRDRIRTAKAALGNIEATLNASGTIVPEFEQIMTSPIRTTILDVNLQAGESVQAGQSILKLDLETIQNELNKLTDEYELKTNRIEKQKLTVAREMQELNSSLDVRKLKVKFLESSLEREQKLFEIGAATSVSVEQAKLNLEIDQRELQLLKTKIKNQEKALEADLKELQLEVQIQERTIRELKNKLEEAHVKAMYKGIVTWVNNKIGASVAEREVIAKISDLASFKIEATISDIYSDRIARNQRVRVRLNNKDFMGTIKFISPSAEEGIINFLVELDDKTNEILRPNLRVEVFVITSVKKNVITVKNGPFFTAATDQKLFVVKGNKAIRENAEFGVSNFDLVEIKKGAKPGDEIIISNMEDYYHMSEIDIE